MLVDYLRGDERAARRLGDAVAGSEPVSASVLSKVEILAGVREGEETRVRSLFDALQWVPVTDAVADEAGELARLYRHSHGGIETVDYVVAATARELRADLWTGNIRHFPMFPDLRAPY